MSEYEFSNAESAEIANWAKNMRIFGILNIVLGLIALIAVLPTTVPFSIGFFARLFNGVTSSALGIVLLRPIDNLRRITKTEGSDIEELMTALGELLSGFNVVFVLSVFYIVVVILEVIARLVG